MYDVKGNLNGVMEKGDHITAKNGLGDNLRSANKEYRLKIGAGVYLHKGIDLIWFHKSVLDFNKSSQVLLYLNDEGELLLYAKGEKEWEIIDKIIQNNIDSLNLDNEGNLYAYKNGIKIWQNGIEIADIPKSTCGITLTEFQDTELINLDITENIKKDVTENTNEIKEVLPEQNEIEIYEEPDLLTL